MSKNLMPEVAALLGVEIGEEFKLNSKGESKVSYGTYAAALVGLLTGREIKTRQRISLIEL